MKQIASQFQISGRVLEVTPLGNGLINFATALFPYMTLVRFIADYINGDTYFRCQYPEHNLVRSRNQLKLTQCVEACREEMKRYIEQLNHR